MPDTECIIVIDSRSAEDGSVWYIDRFASSDEAEDGSAENLNTLMKVRMGLEDAVSGFVYES